MDNKKQSEESTGGELLIRQFKINEHISEAMDILDELASVSQCSKFKLGSDDDEDLECETGDANETIQKYEKWQLKWSKMLNFMF